jgi:hypothetical protein
MFDPSRCVIERIDNPHINSDNIFSQMKNILDYHAPQEEPDYSFKSLHPMISLEQALKELLELSKNEANTNK